MLQIKYYMTLSIYLLMQLGFSQTIVEKNTNPYDGQTLEPIDNINKQDQALTAGIGINTANIEAALQVQGTSDDSYQRVLWLTSELEGLLLMIKNDGSVDGDLSKLWIKEIPTGGSLEKVLSVDRGNAIWVESGFTTNPICDITTVGKIRYNRTSNPKKFEGCVEVNNAYAWEQLNN